MKKEEDCDVGNRTPKQERRESSPTDGEGSDTPRGHL